MSLFKQQFKLKQHTPIIHFQHEQDGATLRASEVKPKLDKFIHTRLMGFLGGKKIYDEYKDIITEYIPTIESTDPSAYKMRIWGEKVKEYYITSSKKQPDSVKGIEVITSAPYFADNEFLKKEVNIKNARKGVMYKNIVLEIFCFEPKVIELIGKVFPYFFACNNFGTRQSKGFGSFSLESTQRYDFEKTLLENLSYREIFFKKMENKFIEIFKKIDNDYKKLKKSQLMEYYSTQKNINWENDIIKKELINKNNRQNNRQNKTDYSEDNQCKYIRALLGLAELYEFSKFNIKVKIECSDESIKRFRSPMTFKIFDSTIYILIENIPDEIYDKKFKFYTSEDSHVFINTPSISQSLDLEKFLKCSLDKSWSYLSQKVV
jgi:hypothetical protein